ncbi:hypothetical protein AVEN_61823-1 [Araneus ventricosus]|uniref:Uncharacterized protein n=1 Tax=Araneus ventricosus TaxID=182803 RepID=A0A4Y2LVJ9_ARAVE|nr:hypothetical protein AVEN_61823-1 [Araneus ventricosus]
MNFAMRTNQYLKKDYDKIDRAVRKGIKYTLNLPRQAANAFLYGSRKMGCCAIPIAAEEMDLNLIDTASKILTSRDDTTQINTLNQLKASVRFRNRRTQPTPTSVNSFLESLTTILFHIRMTSRTRGLLHELLRTGSVSLGSLKKDHTNSSFKIWNFAPTPVASSRTPYVSIFVPTGLSR